MVAEDAAEIDAAPTASSQAGDPEPEENIYQVMKGHMARQKEELEAKNAAARQGKSANGRPGPAPTEAPPKVTIQRVTDLRDLPGVWAAARNFLSVNARMLESVLGQCTRVDALNLETNEVTLVIPDRHERFTGDKARAKLEEALRAVTGLTLKLLVNFVDLPLDVPPDGVGVVPGAGQGGGPGAQRVAPEVLEAVKSQPIIKELMKRLDATVTQVEMLNTGEDGEKA